jgi:hypothetical protein
VRPWRGPLLGSIFLLVEGKFGDRIAGMDCCCGAVASRVASGFWWFRKFAWEHRVWFWMPDSTLTEVLHGALGSLAAFSFAACGCVLWCPESNHLMTEAL